MPHDSPLGFGELLRQYRQAAGLTQEGLAERAGLSVHGIQKLERGVTHPYRDTAKRLAAVLSLSAADEDQLRAAVQSVRRHGSARADPPSGQLRHNLPTSVSSFIGRDEDDVLDLLAGLVRKSLVVASEAADGTQRYALLETVRDYARQKLLARGIAETTAARERHAVFYSHLAERFSAGAALRGIFAAAGPGAAELRCRIEEVHDNLRTAIGWCLEARHPVEGLHLAVALSGFWMWSGLYAEARRHGSAEWTRFDDGALNLGGVRPSRGR